MVVAVDEKPSGGWGEMFEAIASEPWLTVGCYDPTVLDGVDLVVPSPGIPPYNDILASAQKETSGSSARSNWLTALSGCLLLP